MRQLSAARALGRDLPVTIRTSFLARTRCRRKLMATKIDPSTLFAGRCCRRWRRPGLQTQLMLSWNVSLFGEIKRRGCFMRQRCLGCRSVARGSVVKPRRSSTCFGIFRLVRRSSGAHGSCRRCGHGTGHTVAVLLPGAFYFIRETTKPPVELFRAHGVNMALLPTAIPAARR